jgi:sugar phosphate isomerase/epimerase
MFHVKDAELNPTGKSGVYGGYQDWIDRPGRFRSLGDGQVDFQSIFSKLAQYDYNGWAVLEWECCMKHPEQGAAEGAPFIQDHIIHVTDKTFDDFASAGKDLRLNKRVLGLI